MPTLEQIEQLPQEQTPLPIGWPFLTAAWRNLVMLSFDIKPHILEPYVPRGVELDLYEGRALVSIVAFEFHSPRFYGIPGPFCACIPEINLRFYVQRQVAGNRRPGVVFLKELAPRRALAMAAVANIGYREHYHLLPMRYATSSARENWDKTFTYQWKIGGRWNGLEATTCSAPRRPVMGSEEEFVVDHWFAYTRQADGSCVERQVAHAPWFVRPVDPDSLAFRCDAASLFGPQFTAAFQKPPSSAFVSNGSAVGVFHGLRVE